MKFYNSVGPNPRIVRMFMAEKGIEMPKQTVDLRKGENREAEHLKRNPHGQMPTLELDDGSYLSEITAICEYLEEKHPNPPLIGTTPEQRAECRMWTRRVDLNICEHLGNGFRFGEGLKFFEKRIPVAPEASPGLKMIAANRLQWLDSQMADGRLSLRQAFYAGRHPALWLARFRRPGRPAAGCGQHQHRGLDGARRGAALREGVSARVLSRHCERSEAIHSATSRELEVRTSAIALAMTWTGQSLHHYRRIRQFIRAAAASGKCIASSPRHGLDSLDHAAFEVACPETRFHLPADFFPAGVADPGVDATIGNDLEIVVGQQQVDQDPVVVGGVPDPQLRKDIQRPFPRRLIAKQRPAVERALDHEAYLSGMGGLARLDRSDSASVVGGKRRRSRQRCSMRCLPMRLMPMLPAPRRAAAAETAAAAATALLLLELPPWTMSHRRRRTNRPYCPGDPDTMR